MSNKFQYKITKSDIIRKLQRIRDEEAKKMKIESYKILQNATIFEIAEKMPATPQDLLNVKGIGEKKLKKYGNLILQTIHGEVLDEKNDDLGKDQKNQIFTVSSFLDFVNELMVANVEDYLVLGEISSLNFHTSGVYFTIQDKDDESVLNCWMPPRFYEMLGFAIEEGMEVKITGYPNIHKPKGRFSFVVQNLELAGEGSLKKAYELLKKKLQQEGLYERKRELPEFIQNIGLITSETSAAIDDFRKNLDKRGYKIKFHNVYVEGAKAAKDVERAIKYINDSGLDLDVLVITRGGGSLEDLQAFNNELVARAVFASPIPTITAIGHERDVSIVSLVGDVSPSTPTAAAMTINETWSRAEESLPDFQHKILNKFQEDLSGQLNDVNEKMSQIALNFEKIFQRFKLYEEKLSEFLRLIEEKISRNNKFIKDTARNLENEFSNLLVRHKERVKNFEKYLESNSPERNLKLGYSIVTDKTGKVIKSVQNIKLKDMITTEFYDGTVDAKVEKIIGNK